MVSMSRWRMIFSESRFPPIGSKPEGMLFGIMLEGADLAPSLAITRVVCARADGRLRRRIRDACEAQCTLKMIRFGGARIATTIPSS
jgi:hypothetical protein